MEPSEKTLFELVKENNILLRKINRRERNRSLLGIIKLVIIVGLTASAYYYVQPYLEQIQAMYTNINEGSDALRGISEGFKFDPTRLKEMFGTSNTSE